MASCLAASAALTSPCRNRRNCRGSRSETAAGLAGFSWGLRLQTPGQEGSRAHGCTCTSLLDARSEAGVLSLSLPTMQNVVSVTESTPRFLLVQWHLCSVPSIFLKLQQQLYWTLDGWFGVFVIPVSNRSFS